MTETSAAPAPDEAQRARAALLRKAKRLGQDGQNLEPEMEQRYIALGFPRQEIVSAWAQAVWKRQAVAAAELSREKLAALQQRPPPWAAKPQNPKKRA